jgi:hypothetical protein
MPPPSESAYVGFVSPPGLLIASSSDGVLLIIEHQMLASMLTPEGTATRAARASPIDALETQKFPKLDLPTRLLARNPS